MSKTKTILSVICAIVLTLSIGFSSLYVSSSKLNAEKSTPLPMRLWYDTPVSKGNVLHYPSTGADKNVTAEQNRWQQLMLPIGNGNIGASVYGEIKTERLVINEKTFWSGGPSNSRPNYIGGNLDGVDSSGKKKVDYFNEIRSSTNYNVDRAKSNQLIGAKNDAGFGTYLPWGDIYLDYDIVDETKTTNYSRSLNLDTGVAEVSFDNNGTHYQREYFVSYPDNVLVMRLKATNGKMDVGVRFVTAQGALPQVKDNTIVLKGELNDNQMQYNSAMKATNTDGAVVANNGQLKIANASEILLVMTAATDYKNLYPAYRTFESGEQLAARVNDRINFVAESSFEDLLDVHLTDYTELYSRLALDIGQKVPSAATSKLLDDYRSGTLADSSKKYLEALLYQYGRYLTIAGSRENSQLPTNLQGLWNIHPNAPWASDYHMNVNLQMNYWPTYSANLAECAMPLINYVESLRAPGRVSAEIYTGVSSRNGEQNGFMAHTQNNPFGWTSPGWSFDWGWSPVSVPWILQNVWEHYEYSGDVEFMRERIYPMLREEAVYFDKLLISDGNGRMVMAPSYSPEHGPRTFGNVYEQVLIWQLYNDTIQAAEILGVDSTKVAEWKETMKKLKPIELGTSGQIKEWYSETGLGSLGTDRKHRHMSHLLGLFPGDLISREENATNGFMDAAKVSLNDRGDKSTGWAMGQRINSWARTGDGDRSYTLIQSLLTNGIYPNLLDSHPPFQIDGNFGLSSGMNEMLLQSNFGFLDILPALPSSWSNGSVKGIVGRGNFELDITWKSSKATSIKILSKNGGFCTLKYSGIARAKLYGSDGKAIEFKVIDNNKIQFSTNVNDNLSVVIE